MNSLSNIRTQIDELDNQIADLLDKRYELMQDVAKAKQHNDIKLKDSKREHAIVDRLVKLVHHDRTKEALPEIYETIIKYGSFMQVLHMTPSIPFPSVGIIGLGVIGGSIAKAIKLKDRDIIVSTLARDSEDNRLATKQKILDKEYTTLNELLRNVTLLIIASPIDTVISYAKELANLQMNDNIHRIVIDVASTKNEIVNELSSLKHDSITFLPTHPMAGSDREGFSFAKGTMFIQNPWLICPNANCDNLSVKKIHQFVSALGSKPVEVNGDLHDKIIASSSHLVRFIAMLMFAYIHDKKSKSLAVSGTGFKKSTQLASSNPYLNSNIFECNWYNVRAELEEFIQYISQFDSKKFPEQSFFSELKKKRDTFLASR